MTCPVCGESYEERRVVQEALQATKDIDLCAWFGADLDDVDESLEGAAAVFIHGENVGIDEMEVDAHT